MPLRYGAANKTAIKTENSTSNRLERGVLVEYEQHGKPNLAVILGENKGKWAVANASGAELQLPATRLYRFSVQFTEDELKANTRTAKLEELQSEVAAASAKIDLRELWELVLEEPRDYSLTELIELSVAGSDHVACIALRQCLLEDRIYFKRKKNGFSPRAPQIVEELIEQIRVEEEKERRRMAFVEAVLGRLSGETSDIPEEIFLIEDLAVHGTGAREINPLIDEIAKQGNLSLTGKAEERAFDLLLKLGIFGADENLSLRKARCPIDFSSEALAESQQIAANFEQILADAELCDHQALNCIAIDSADTKDIDDALSLESRDDGSILLGIHISNVALFLANAPKLLSEALERGSSIYCPEQQVPMLPLELSQGVLSLWDGKQRACISFFIELNSSHEIISRFISRSLITVSRRLSYTEVDAVLTGSAEDPAKPLLLELWEAVCSLERRRIEADAMHVARTEVTPVVATDGRIYLDTWDEDAPARKLVSELMVLANESAALFARENHLPFIFRSQEPPDSVDPTAIERILPGPAQDFFLRGLLKRSLTSTSPGPHAALGLSAYGQATSPIRRMSDLCNQRQIEHFLRNKTPFYSEEELAEIMLKTEEALASVRLVQKERERYWKYKYLLQESISELRGVVVRTDGPKPLIECQFLGMILPFRPQGHDDRWRKRISLGSEISVEVSKVNPRNDDLILREKLAKG